MIVVAEPVLLGLKKRKRRKSLHWNLCLSVCLCVHDKLQVSKLL